MFFQYSCNIFYLIKGCPFHINANLPNLEGESRLFNKEIADPETSTPNGCTCKSLCGATVEDGFTKVESNTNFKIILAARHS